MAGEDADPAGAAPRAGQATCILRALERGEPGSSQALFLLVYDELRRLASGYLDRERPDHTLQATALVHEAWLRLVDVDAVEWQGRAHFLGVAARAMRQILVEHARSRQRRKRGGGWRRTELDPALAATADGGPDLVALDRALERLGALSARQAKVFELRFFGGLPVASVAFLVGVSERTVEREWRFARAWLAEAVAASGE
jgi:RNA polymerase sigma factor (TIGR02999 family)